MHGDDPMTKEIFSVSGMSAGRRVAARIRFDVSDTLVRRGPIRSLMLCGIMLIAAIAIGTAMTVANFRQRALDIRQNELENTISLLVGHFDQQLEEFGLIQKDSLAQIQSARIAAPDILSVGTGERLAQVTWEAIDGINYTVGPLDA
jgi:hypothetical protein